MPQIDLSVYLIIGPQDCPGQDPVAVVEAAVNNGTTLVQLRDKTGSTREQVDLARRMMAVLEPKGIPLIVNDRVDVALAVDAPGVHVGQSDMSAADARRLIGPEKVLGLSVSSQADLDAADPAILQYLGIGACYPTGSKADADDVGIKSFGALTVQSSLPVVGIGGINHSNAEEVIAHGAAGVAVISAICGDHMPGKASADLAKLVFQAKQRYA
ncbi:thiamine phosphate synthase [Pseudovibrio exalbescens]|uniref:thiamine phosphate synthase n=1 Tax=Pseudovibrio exalbescens TaxID=197461 RepID=UPI002365B829|nr:thiamine phosphate synthase [Pseudovibrio exalbescens]MDD7909754.1 thiamine phosphate synthase [Pseudovibrio exalbescens]